MPLAEPQFSGDIFSTPPVSSAQARLSNATKIWYISMSQRFGDSNRWTFRNILLWRPLLKYQSLLTPGDHRQEGSLAASPCHTLLPLSKEAADHSCGCCQTSSVRLSSRSKYRPELGRDDAPKELNICGRSKSNIESDHLEWYLWRLSLFLLNSRNFFKQLCDIVVISLGYFVSKRTSVLGHSNLHC